MEEFLIKTIPSVGSAGILAVVLWHIAKRFMDETMKQQAETTRQMSNRIDSLESHIKQCDDERRDLYKKYYRLAAGKSEELED